MNSIIKYDKKARVQFKYSITLKILWYYKYQNNYRKEYIYCPNNKTNFYTITKQKEINSTYKNISSLQIGSDYIIYHQFDDNNNVIFECRRNLIKNTKFKKKSILLAKDSSVWVYNYNGEKSIGLKVNPNKINYGKKN